MSSTQLLDSQLLVRLLASKYYMLASVVILYFDYFLTFDLEVRQLWRKPFTGPTFLFLLNRYFPLLVYALVLIAVHDPSWSAQTCDNFKRFPLIATLVSEAIIGIIVILRIYALYSRNNKILSVLLSLYVLQLMLGGWASDAVVQASGLPPASGCIVAVLPELTARFAWFWGSTAIFDSLVFGLTLYRTLWLRRAGLRAPLTMLFFRDGLVYFAVMFSAKLLNFVLFWTAVTSDLVTLNWTFNNIITVIMINRLVLNLRQQGSRSATFSPPEGQNASTRPFMETFVIELEQSIPGAEPEEMYEAEEAVTFDVGHDPFSKLEKGRM